VVARGPASNWSAPESALSLLDIMFHAFDTQSRVSYKLE
jgi:hypothetical protein